MSENYPMLETPPIVGLQSGLLNALVVCCQISMSTTLHDPHAAHRNRQVRLKFPSPTELPLGLQRKPGADHIRTKTH